jgi:hypothetical protein
MKGGGLEIYAPLPHLRRFPTCAASPPITLQDIHSVIAASNPTSFSKAATTINSFQNSPGQGPSLFIKVNFSSDTCNKQLTRNADKHARTLCGFGSLHNVYLQHTRHATPPRRMLAVPMFPQLRYDMLDFSFRFSVWRGA